jgi:mono/diheme cytochrome c family protein
MYILAVRNSAVFIGCVLGAIGSVCFGQPLPPPGECPQPRFTGKAPEEYYSRKNPLEANDRNLKAGERLYAGGKKLFGCAKCHGTKGDGKGELASQFVPRPRNFACAQTVNNIPDGQLFWIIRFGSPGTSMPAHEELADEQVWQLVLHLRRLAK